jgi:uncharacterized protein YjbI with pentapeptide repeats
MTTLPARDVYPGLAPFRDNPVDSALFFGREEEAKRVTGCILSEPLIVLYARSGVGKTSLLNAAVIPALRDEGLLPVVVRPTGGPQGPLSAVDIALAAIRADSTLDVTSETSPTLWERFHALVIRKDGRKLTPVLILDQFEELFTRVGVATPEGQEFISQLADVVRGRVPDQVLEASTARLETMSHTDPERQRLVTLLYEKPRPDVKVVLSLREDFLPELDRLRARIPGILRTTIRLQPLSREHARDAITKPPQKAGVVGADTFTIEDDAVDRLLDFLSACARHRTVHEDFSADALSPPPADDAAGSATAVDPVQLQILCQHFDRERRREGRPLIRVADLGGESGMRRVLGRHYRHVLRSVPEVALGWSVRRWRPSRENLLFLHRPRAAVRRLCEVGLITRAGHRNSIIQDVIGDEFGIAASELQKLIEGRLLRVEGRVNSQFYELSHDTLVAPIRSARVRRRLKTAAIMTAAYVALVGLGVLGTNRLDEERRRQAAAADEEALRSELTVAASRNPQEMGKVIQRRAEERVDPGGGGIPGETTVLASDETDFSRISAPGVVLRRLRSSRRLNFEASTLSKGDVRDAVLLGSSFDGADVRGARFTNSALNLCSFRRARAQEADFSFVRAVGAMFDRADLTRSNFFRATIAQGRLVGADVAFARLVAVDMSGTDVEGLRDFETADFTETAWWLAKGWSAPTFRYMAANWPRDRVSASAIYRLTVEEKLQAIRTAGDPTVKAAAFNSLAWFRAIRGADLDAALLEVNESLALNPKDGNVTDTKAYILLQLGRPREAAQMFIRASELLLDPAAPREIGGEVAYRTGVAFEYSGDAGRAAKYFAEAERHNYRPTHEYLLVPRGKKP